MTGKVSKPLDFAQRDELFQDPEYAAIYLNECLADGDMTLFQEALRDVAKAQGGIKAIAEQLGKPVSGVVEDGEATDGDDYEGVVYVGDTTCDRYKSVLSR